MQINGLMAAVPRALQCRYAAVLHSSLIAGAGASGTSEDVRENCAFREAECMDRDEPPYIEVRSLHPADNETEQGFTECSATVNDYRICTADLVHAQADMMAELPACDALDVNYYQGRLNSLPVKLVEPSSCSTLYSECWRLSKWSLD